MSKRPGASSAAPTTANIRVDTTSAPQNTFHPAESASFFDALPGFLKALEPLFRGLWAAACALGKAAVYFVTLLSPAILWAGQKYIKWYVMKYINKATKVLRWVTWALGLLPKGSGSGGGAAAS